MKAGIVLFGHGARDPEWARPMRRARERLQEQLPQLGVELAFLEFMQPDLAGAIDALAGAGVRRITVVPMFLAQGGHVKKDLPEQLERARARHPDCELRLVSAVGEAEGVLAAMAAYAAQSAGFELPVAGAGDSAEACRLSGEGQ